MVKYNVGYTCGSTNQRWVITGTFPNEEQAIGAAKELFRDFIKVNSYVQVRIEKIER